MSLYTSASGREVNAHSYSGGQEFKFCRRKYKLHRIVGWQEKAKKGALEIGKVIESAIQFYHENGLKPGDCVGEWKRLWLKFSEIQMDFTDQEGNWSEVYTMGAEWARLYEVLLPSLPISSPKFQLEYRKEVFAGSGLEFLGYVDMLSTSTEGVRTVIDIKSAKMSLDLTPNLLALDPQLRRYAWLTGVQDVAFLWFVKAKPNSFKKGDSVTLLEDIGEWKAGRVLSVVKYEEIEHEKGLLKLLTVGDPAVVQIMDESLIQISGKGSKEAKEKVSTEYLTEGKIVVVHRDSVTKTRLQYVKAFIPLEELPEIGDSIGHEIISIKDAYEKDKFPKDGGVRFPNNQCTWCSYRGICLNDKKLTEDLLVQISPTNREKDWLDELVEEN